MSNYGLALVVEDDPNSAEAIAKVVRSLGYDTAVAGTLESAKAQLQVRSHALVFLDIGLPDGNGLDLLKSIEDNQRPHIIVITGNDSKEVVLNSLRANVTDFLQKPVSLNDLKSCVRRLTASNDKVDQKDDQLPLLPHTETGNKESVVFSGQSTLVRELIKNVQNCAKTSLNCVVSGDVGVDKKGVAHALHVKSDRIGRYVFVEASDFQFNAFNTPSDSAQTDLSLLINSWLDLAENGTLTVGDLTSIPIAQQRLLSRLLGVQSDTTSSSIGTNRTLKKLPARIIGLLNEPWEHAVEKGELSPELYHRLAQYSIKVPSLKNRISDVVFIANSIIERLNREYKTDKVLSEEAMEQLQLHTWPGQLLELENILTQSFANSVQKIVIAPDLISSNTAGSKETQSIDSLVGKSFWQVEKTLLFATLEHNQGDKVATAKSLGISLKTLYNRLNAYS